MARTNGALESSAGYPVTPLRKKALVLLLCFANLFAAGAVIFLATGLSYAQRQGLGVSDLVYGRIDVDGDGECTPGDDFWVYMALEHWPDALEKALRDAKMREDGSVDLSPYLRSVDHLRIEAAKRAAQSD